MTTKVNAVIPAPKAVILAPKAVILAPKAVIPAHAGIQSIYQFLLVTLSDGSLQS